MKQQCFLRVPDSQSFIEFTLSQNSLRVRRGQISKPCLVFELNYTAISRGQKVYDGLLAEFQKRGFKEEPNPPAAIVEGTKVGELFTDEMGDVFSDFFKIGWARDWKDDRNRVFHCAEGLTYEGNLDLEIFADLGLTAGLIVSGDVQIKGVFSQTTYTYPGAILIRGDVTANSLIHADSHMVITGNLNLENTAFGYYNDGSLAVHGAAYGKLWLSCDHDMWASSYHFHTGIGIMDEAEDDAFIGRVLHLDGSVSWDEMEAVLMEGICPLQSGYLEKLRESEELELGEWDEDEAEDEDEDPDKFGLVNSITGSFLRDGADDDEGDEGEDEFWPERLAKPPSGRKLTKQLKRANELNAAASQEQDSSPQLALEKYELVLSESQAYAQHYIEFEYTYLFTLLGRLQCVYKLSEQGEALGIDSRALANEVLGFVEQGEDLYYMQALELSEMAHLLAYNTLAREDLKQGRSAEMPKSQKHFEDALENINEGFSEFPSAISAKAALPALENKVQILLALGRKEEAHDLVYPVRKQFPELEGFKKWVSDEAQQN